MRIVGALAILLLAASPPALAESKLSVVHQTWVTLEVTVVAQDARGRTQQVKETVRGRVGERLAFATPIGGEGGEFIVGLVFFPRPDPQRGQLSVRVEADAQPPKQRRVDSTRTLTLTPGRVALSELWRAPTGKAAIVMAISGRWEEVPVLTAILPGAEPVDLVIEVVARDATGDTLLEQHRLGGVVGSPVGYAIGQNGGSAPASDQLAIEVLPKLLSGSRLTIGARLLKDGQESPTAVAVEETLMSGFSLDLALPADPASPARQLIIRVTPFF